MKFPKDFRFGWSQAGFQSEMGTPGSEDKNSDWYAWVHDPENIAAGLVSGDLPENGPGYWGNYKAFHDAAQSMGLTIARLNTEWSRIFPNPPPKSKGAGSEEDLKQLDAMANKDAIAHYREMFSDLKRRGIYLILNLYHWPLPLWVHDPIAVRRGQLNAKNTGWLNHDHVEEFARYAAFIAWKFDDLADEYSTMNEPNVVYEQGFGQTKSGFPPGYLSFTHLAIARHNIIEAHARAYDAIKKLSKKPVGIIYANSAFTPLTGSDQKAVEAIETDERWSFFDAIIRGKLDGESRDDLKGRLDWIGVNYYTRLMVQAAGSRYRVIPGYGFACERNSISLAGRPTSDFGWEFYPEGLQDLLVKYWKRYSLPIYVTENGIADEADYQRPYYLVSHVASVQRALEEGANVKGYLHWSLADNYEWASGFGQKFGLIKVDYATKKLYWRPSAFVYREIATNHEITDKIEHLNSVPPIRALHK